ncbi:MAG: LD-carboxypeptidase [Deltaproteobacteria bacterium]|nr:LD-carboxypeptidase [Deltaproteobacteria bacterium]
MPVIYTITPSWLIKKKKDFTDGLKNLEKLGFTVLNRKVPSHLPSHAAKARQIHEAFLNPKVEIILAQRGGYSAMKVLPHLDFRLIQKHPKIFAGFSDLSALLNPIHERTGLVTLHAPMVINFAKYSRITVPSFLNALHGFPQRNLFAGAPVEVYNSGTARGVLKGGNLVTLTALIGTAWEIGARGSILFLEEVDELLYKIDRHLTQWILGGKFRGLRGLILGNFKGLATREVYKILAAQKKIDFPVVHCPCIGHLRHKITLPVGARVELHTAEKSLMIL